MMYMPTMEYYSAIKIGKVLIHVTTWKNLEMREWKKADILDHVSYEPIYKKYPE